MVKDNSRFEFEKTIYLDLFLSKNMEKAKKHFKNLDQMKKDLKILRENLRRYTESDSNQKFDHLIQTL